MRTWCAPYPVWLSLVLLLAPASGLAQFGAPNTTPLGIDLKKVKVGAWAEYGVTANGQELKSRWALVARDGKNSTLEMTMQGGPMAMMGGKMTMKMVLAPDPTAAQDPVKQLVMQMGDRDPMELPAESARSMHKFIKPDPRKLVGAESVKVPAGTFKARHYRDSTEQATFDAWVSEDVPPLGMVKVSVVPKPGATGPNGQPMPQIEMQLTGRGKDARPTVTKPAKPFDPQVLMGGGAAPPAK